MVLHTVNGETKFNDRLLSSIENDEHREMKAILEKVEVKDLVDSAGMTLLHHATKADNEVAVKYLIEEKGCEIDALDNSGNTALMEAVRWKYQPLLLLLVKSNADVLLSGQGKDNPLKMVLAPESEYDRIIYIKFFHSLKRRFLPDKQQIATILMDAKCSLPQAVHLQDDVITRHMLDAGCQIDCRDPMTGLTALHFAFLYVDSLNVKLLLERGADVNAENDAGQTPLDCYIPGERGSGRVLEALLDHDHSLGPSTVEGYEFASKQLGLCISTEVEVLLNQGFDFADSTWNDDRRTLLHMLARNTNPGVMEVLSGRPLDVHATDTAGLTVLLYAGMSCNPSNLEFLLKRGADPNSTNAEGETVFCYCFREWTSAFSVKDDSSSIEATVDSECVEVFLEYGADVQCTDNRGRTIFDVALHEAHYNHIEPIISQLAIIEAKGQEIRGHILHKVAKNRFYSRYHLRSKREIKKLRNTMIDRTVCLFQFLTDSEEQLLGHVQQSEAAETFLETISKDEESDIFINKCLRKRVRSILQTIKFRRRSDAASAISRLTGIDNQFITRKCILYLDAQSLRNLSET